MKDYVIYSLWLTTNVTFWRGTSDVVMLHLIDRNWCLFQRDKPTLIWIVLNSSNFRDCRVSDSKPSLWNFNSMTLTFDVVVVCWKHDAALEKTSVMVITNNSMKWRICHDTEMKLPLSSDKFFYIYNVPISVELSRNS